MSFTLDCIFSTKTWLIFYSIRIGRRPKSERPTIINAERMRKWRSNKLNKLLNKRLFNLIEILLIAFFFALPFYTCYFYPFLCISGKS